MRTTTEWFSGDVLANGIKQHDVRADGDGPPLVLAHGATDAGLCWTRLARALESDYDVVTPDARGHGPSDAPAHACSSVEQAADPDIARCAFLEDPPLRCSAAACCEPR